MLAAVPMLTIKWDIKHFLAFMAFIDSTAEEDDRKRVKKEGQWHAAKGPRPGVEPWSAAAPQLYQLSLTAPC